MKRGIKLLVLFVLFLFFIPIVKADPAVEETDCYSVNNMMDEYDAVMTEIDNSKCDTLTAGTNDTALLGTCEKLYTSKSYYLSILFRKNDEGACSSSRLSNIIKENQGDCTLVLESSLKDFADKIMNIFYIVAPFLVIIFGSLDFTKVMVATNPKDISKHRKNFIRRLIAMVLLFLSPFIVNILLKISPDVIPLESNLYTCKKPIIFSAGSFETTYVQRVNTTKTNKRQTSYTGIASKGGQRLVDIALQELGNNDGDGSNLKYGREIFGWNKGNPPWCAAFVSWCAKQAGYIDSGIIPKYANCEPQYFRDKGAIEHREGDGYNPVAGDIVFFYWDGNIRHTGIVISSTDDTVYTIEGNTPCTGEAKSMCNGYYGVSKHEYQRTSGSRLYIYMTPLYPE